VFAIQFAQRPAQMLDGAVYRHAIDCVMRTEVAPDLARGRPNLVVFDEDIGLETIAAGPRGARARALLRTGAPPCAGLPSPCQTLAALTALDGGYGRALAFLEPRFPPLKTELGRSFVAATDEFVRVFMTTMATEATRYHVYVIASNTQAPFRLTRSAVAVAALRDPATPGVRSVYEPTAGRAYDQTFVWGPRVVHRQAPAPTANLIAVNRKLPLTAFEQAGARIRRRAIRGRCGKGEPSTGRDPRHRRPARAGDQPSRVRVRSRRSRPGLPRRDRDLCPLP